jgi:hypothetical protein
MGAQTGDLLVGHGGSVWIKEIYSKEQKSAALHVQGFYESKLRAWAYDCQQNQSPSVHVGGP